jgi:hypothetical protein
MGLLRSTRSLKQQLHGKGSGDDGDDEAEAEAEGRELACILAANVSLIRNDDEKRFTVGLDR